MIFTSKDQLTHYMVAGHVHLSKKDYGFYNNIKISIQNHKPITSNQNKLFDKLLLKYQRQLSKLNHDIQQLVILPWKVDVIETKQEYLDANISILGNTIAIKSPFNSKFIQSFRKLPMNQFVWNKESKIYEAPFSTYQLKLAVDSVNKFYKTVSYCNKVTELLKEINQYSMLKYWSPTLVQIGDRFYIMASNDLLEEAIKNIPLNTNPETLFLLTQYGVKIDESVQTDELSRFASEFIAEVDIDKLDTYASYLKKLNVNYVVLNRDLLYNKEFSKEIKSIFTKHDITTFSFSEYNTNDHAVLVSFRFRSMHENLHDRKVSKILSITNSRPVVVK